MVFIPSWFHRGQDRDRQSELRASLRAERRAVRLQERQRKRLSSAVTLKRLYRSRRLGVLMVVLAVAAAAAPSLAALPAVWIQPAWVAAVVLGLLGTSLVAAANRRIPQLLLKSIRTRQQNSLAVSTERSTSIAAAAAAERALPRLGPPMPDPRLWQATRLPKPSELQRGQLEQVRLAEVRAIAAAAEVEASEATPESVVLDLSDVLRRRREAG